MECDNIFATNNNKRGEQNINFKLLILNELNIITTEKNLTGCDIFLCIYDSISLKFLIKKKKRQTMTLVLFFRFS